MVPFWVSFVLLGIASCESRQFDDREPARGGTGGNDTTNGGRGGSAGEAATTSGGEFTTGVAGAAGATSDAQAGASGERSTNGGSTNEGGASTEVASAGGGATSGGTSSAGGSAIDGGAGGDLASSAAGAGGADGDGCRVGADCDDGSCNSYFLDADGDGHGINVSEIRRCTNLAPTGYARVGGDCCDIAGSAVSATIHPGQLAYSVVAAGICGLSFDYNCDGVDEQRYPLGVECDPISCTTNTRDGGGLWSEGQIPNCGVSAYHPTGCSGNGGSSCSFHAGVSDTQSCR